MNKPTDTADRTPDTIATPEGDTEFASDQPLGPVEGLATPPGSAPAADDADEPSAIGEMIEALDEISRGKMIP
jgi:hypothetical protein